jgi:hypothetical protein
MKNGNYRPMKIVLAVSFVMLFFVSLPISANAFERPEFQDGLTDSWHPGAFCIPCHYTLLSKDKAQSISNGCKCHDYVSSDAVNKYSVDMKKIFDIHKDIVCIRCHAGVKDGNNITASDFHRIMSKEACLACHTYVNGTIQKPQKTNCSDCHSGDPHVVHGNKLENMCVICHGDFAQKYVTNKTVGTVLAKPVEVVPEYPTIGQIISNLLGSVSQIFR